MNHCKHLIKALLVGGIVCLFVSGCRPPVAPALEGRLVIASHVGEITEEVQCIHDSVKYRIYYEHNADAPETIRITDVLDEKLKEIQALQGGGYDTSNHTVEWILENVPPGERGFVEVIAVIREGDEIRNQAKVAIEGKQELVTNTVRTEVCKPPTLGWIPFIKDAESGEAPDAYMKDETTVGLTVNFNIPGMFVNARAIDGVTYHRMFLPGWAALSEVGKPELPIVGQILEIPFGVDISLEIVKSTSLTLDRYNVYPVQEPRIDQEEIMPGFVIDRTAYQSGTLYPDTPASVAIEDIGVIRGHRVVHLKVNPVQYNPVSKEVLAYSQIEVRLNYDHPAQIDAASVRTYSAAFEDLLERTLLNYPDQERFDTDQEPKEYEGIDYLIITHGDFYNDTDPNNPVVLLENWKQQKGYRTLVVDIADIPNGQDAEDIRDYLQNAYDTWFPPPTYVLLVGDSDFIPTNYITQHSDADYNNARIGTDLYYTTLDNPQTSDDYFPDIFIGRLPVETLAEARDVIDKLIEYETNPPANANFYTDATLIALFEDDTDFPGDPDGEDGIEDRPWIENVEEIREYLELSGYNAERIYGTSSGFPGDPFSDDPTNYEDGTALPDDLTVAGNPAAGIPGFGWNGGLADINNAITNGSFLVTYRDHGDRVSWSGDIGGFDQWDATGLANADLTPVVLSIACETGWFDNESDDDATLAGRATGNNDECLGEHFILNNNGGAVAFVGSTRNSWTGKNDFLMFGLHQAIWPDFDPDPPLLARYPDIPPSGTNPLLRMGQVLNFGKHYMANAYSHDDIRLQTFEMYHLFGDPEMPIWTEQPGEFSVTHPEGIGSVGEQDFVVTVTDRATNDPVKNVVVALTRSGDLLAVRHTNPGGIARFSVSGIGTGDLDITATAFNYQPYQGVIEVNDGGAYLNRLDPQDGTTNTDVLVGGRNFSGNENVDILFAGQTLDTVPASAGEFGQSGVEDITIQVPSPFDLGPVNISAQGQTSNRYAVDVFHVRSANPIDLYTYSQWDSTTWHLSTGNDPVWNNPEIQLYDSTGNPVGSNNLTVGSIYTVEIKVHNDTDFDANNVEVTLVWANFGVGQSDRVWQDAGDATIDVPAHSVVPAEIEWKAPGTGHLCILAEIYHIEDIVETNNRGQENLHVGPTSSPAEVAFTVYNPSKEAAAIHLELRQLLNPGLSNKIWAAWVEHPDPQVIPPGEWREAKVIIDAKRSEVDQGETAEFVLTAFLDGEMIGGVNFIITVK